MTRHTLTAEDLWAMPRVGSPVPAPDGSFAIVPVTSWSLDRNEGASRLYKVCATGTDEPRALTSAESSSSEPAVSPDGRRVAFVRKPVGAGKSQASEQAGGAPVHSDQPQLHVLSLDGGEAERLTDLPFGVGDPAWFPDGRRVAFIAAVYADAPEPGKTAQRKKERNDDPVKAHTSEDRVYRFWDRWLTEGRVHHIFVLDLETREITDLTPRSKRWFPLMDASGHYRISPDGREIAFTACRSEPPYDPLLWNIWTVPVADPVERSSPVPPAIPTSDDPVCLAPDHTGHALRPVYSPDGKRIIYGIQRETDFYADRVRLVSFDRASKKHTVLTESWDRSADSWSFAGKGQTLVLLAEAEARVAVYTMDVAAAEIDPDGHAPIEIARGGWFDEPRAAGGRLFATCQSLSRPAEAISLALDGSDRRELTSFAAPMLDSLELGEVEEAWFEGAGGRRVQMFLIHPPSSRRPASGERPPLVHVIHGGPHGASGDHWHWRWNAQAFAAPGHLVALVNFHGSTGWGQEFTASILGRWGDQPYADVMAATDWLVEHERVDPRRMAATGGSYGGYLVSWIAGQTDRFACLVSHAGVSDFQTQYASDVTEGRRRSMGGEPWDDVDGMDRYNPARQAAGYRSPMLVIHGQRDYRVPYNQALEIYNVYKAMGLPARLVIYPDEGHWILKPRNSAHWYGEVLDWLDRWIGSRPKP